MSGTLLDLKNLLSSLNLERSGLALALVAEVGAGKSFAVAKMLREISVGSVVVNANAALPGLLMAFGQSGNNISEQEALEIMVVQISQRAPFILCLEDFHEASLQRQDLWLGLANRCLKTSGVALLLTSRTPVAAPVQSFFLEPFSTSDLGAILESETGSSLPEAAIDWIASRARGNPLFALEFLKWLARLGFLRSDGQYWRWREPETASLPSRVDALIEQALQPVLAVEQRANALLTAAFLGSLLEFRVWAKISGIANNQLHEILVALERYGIFRRQQFSHPLYREVLLNNYNLKNRDRIARDVLNYLCQNDPVRATELISWVKISALEQYQIFENAVVFARSVQDHVLAARLRFKSVQFAQPQAQVPLLLEAAIWLMPYQLSETLEILERVALLEPLNPSGLKLRLEVLAYSGRSQEALAQLKEIPEHVFDAKTAFNLEFVLLERGGFDAALLSLWQTNSPSQISVLVVRGVILALLRQKDFDLAQEIFMQASKLPKLTKLEGLQVLFAKMQFPHHQHDYVQSVKDCTDFIALLEQTQNHKFEILDLLESAYQIRACAYSALGKPTAAVTDCEQSLVYLKALGHVLLLAVRQCELGLYCLEAGDHTRAAALLVEVRPVLEGMDQALYAYHLNHFRALYLWNLGDEKALQSARVALRNAQDSQVSGCIAAAMQTVALLEASLGSASKALELSAELSCTSNNRLYIQAIAFERLGQEKQAIALLNQAVNNPQRIYLEITPERIELEWRRLSKTPTPEKSSNLEIQILTPELEVLGSIRWHGIALAERGRKALELLVYLLEARVQKRLMVGLEELFEVLYPNQTMLQAKAALKQLVYRMRGFLGATAIVRLAEGYALGDFQTDLEIFLQNPRPELLRGNYISDLGTDHPSSIRECVVLQIQKLLGQLSAQNHPDTMRIARILLETDGYEISSIGQILKAAQQINDSVSAIQIYAQSKLKLEELGETLPQSWQEFLQIHFRS